MATIHPMNKLHEHKNNIKIYNLKNNENMCSIYYADKTFLFINICCL